LCGDGWEPHFPLGCEPFAHRQAKYANLDRSYCDQSVAVNVTAFDGNRKFPDTLNSLIPEIWPKVAGKFFYNHMALLDKPGYISFSQPETEGGMIDFSHTDQSDLSVRGTTVDLYMQENGILTLDVLKVDAEGFDDLVLRGAKNALATSVQFVQFEANPLDIETIHFLDSLGFTCWLAGSKGWPSFVQLTGCIEHDFFRGIFRVDTSLLTRPNLETPIHIGANAYCAHRTRASGLVKLFEENAVMSGKSHPRDLSFYWALNRCTIPPHASCPALTPEQCSDETVDFVCRLRSENWYHENGCADTPGWSTKCHERFMSGYCANGTVPPDLGWIGEDNDRVKEHCCVCGKGS
jgi:FkbM family methyltransferase